VVVGQVNREELQSWFDTGYHSFQETADHFGGASRQRFWQIAREWGITYDKPPKKPPKKPRESMYHPMVDKAHALGYKIAQYKARYGFCALSGCYEMVATDRKMCAEHLHLMRVAKQKRYAAVKETK
jgi:hypothetical protein